MREFAEKVAAFISDTTDYLASVNAKEMPDGSQKYSVVVKRPEDKIAPAIYLDGMYGRLSVEDAALEIIKIAESNKVSMPDISFVTDWDKAKEHITVRLLPKTFHADVFRSAEDFGFDDLILVPYVTMNSIPEIGVGSVNVTSNIIESWGLDEGTVMDKAIQNTINAEISIQSMGGFVARAFNLDMDMPTGFFILSNKDMTYGASAILAALDKLKKKYSDGFYVIPSSVHEVLVLPSCGFDKDYITNLIQEVNTTEVQPEEVLSDHVYQF